MVTATPLPPPGDDRIVPLRVANAARGRIIPPVARALDGMPTLFERTADAFVLRDGGADAATIKILVYA